MNWFRKLVLNFSQIDGFDGWVIAKAEIDFDIDNFFVEDIAPHIVKLKKNYAVINMCGRCYFDIYNIACNITIYLLKPFDINEIKESKPDKQIELDKVFINENLFFKSAYAKDDIENFVKDIGDKNYIHRAEKPIVPGFLLLEDLIFKIFVEVKANGKILSFKSLQMEIIFYNPLYSNEIVKVYSEILCAEKILNKDINEELSKKADKNLNKSKFENLNKENRIKYVAIRNDVTECCIFKAISKVKYEREKSV